MTPTYASPFIPLVLHDSDVGVTVLKGLKVEGPILSVTEKEVEEALRNMKREKAPGPSGVTTDLLRYA